MQQWQRSAMTLTFSCVSPQANIRVHHEQMSAAPFGSLRGLSGRTLKASKTKDANAISSKLFTERRVNRVELILALALLKAKANKYLIPSPHCVRGVQELKYLVEKTLKPLGSAPLEPFASLSYTGVSLGPFGSSLTSASLRSADKSKPKTKNLKSKAPQCLRLIRFSKCTKTLKDERLTVFGYKSGLSAFKPIKPLGAWAFSRLASLIGYLSSRSLGLICNECFTLCGFKSRRALQEFAHISNSNKK